MSEGDEREASPLLVERRRPAGAASGRGRSNLVSGAGNGRGKSVERVIETEGLTKTYSRRGRGIENVDLEVRGEVFGFIGPNGAGKTSTIRTLLGSCGLRGAWVFGRDVRRRSVNIRARVGNLPGEFALEDRMAGEQLLRLFARLRGVPVAPVPLFGVLAMLC